MEEFSHVEIEGLVAAIFSTQELVASGEEVDPKEKSS